MPSTLSFSVIVVNNGAELYNKKGYRDDQATLSRLYVISSVNDSVAAISRNIAAP